MASYPHKLHPPVVISGEHKAAVSASVRNLAERRGAAAPAIREAMPAGATPGPIEIELTTVSLAGNFDAYINIRFAGMETAAPTSLLVDSGNSMLIVPEWEAIENNPAYVALGDAKEPWGSPAKIVRGPIVIPTVGGGSYTVNDCVFYACTGGARTANFGAGNITPWSANGWNTPLPGITMQAPLSYDVAFPFVEFSYAPAASILSLFAAPNVTGGSLLTLYPSQPAGYTLLPIIPDIEWMAVRPASLSIGAATTGWPGASPPAIAMVDTGGGPVFLSDPEGFIWPKPWPDQTVCPTWASGSTHCNCVSDPLTITLTGSGAANYSYVIDPGLLPPSTRGLTGVMCQDNQFMMGQYGMNIGGISALFNNILVDYGGKQIGFQPRTPAVSRLA